MTQYVYSVTITKENDSLAFLKAFDNKIKVNGTYVNETAVVVTDYGTESFSFVAIAEGDTFEEVYELLKRLTCEKKLSCEYVKDGWVYILPYYQLHSREPRRRRNDLIIHNGVPRRRRQYKHVDLRLRSATERDYGYKPAEGEEETVPQLTFEQELKTKRWLGEWRRIYNILYMRHGWYCHHVDEELADSLLHTAFVLTVNRLVCERKEQEPFIYAIGIHSSLESGGKTSFVYRGTITPNMMAPLGWNILDGSAIMALDTLVCYKSVYEVEKLYKSTIGHYMDL